MNLLRLRVTNEVPPDGYKYVEPADGYHLPAQNSKEGWFDAIFKYKQDNGYPIPENWKEEAEDQLARRLPPGWGFYADGTAPDYTVDQRLSGMDVLNGTRVLLELVRRAAAFKLFGLESPIVSQEEAEERALICSRCAMNIPIEGCFSCYGLANLVADVASGIETPSDPYLKSCGICRCHNKAQTRVKAEVLREGVTESQMQMFKSVPHCWKSAALSALSS